MGGGGSMSSTPSVTPTAEPIETKTRTTRTARGGGLKLKGKKTGQDQFVEQLANEGVHVTSTNTKKEVTKTQTPAALLSDPDFLAIFFNFFRKFRKFADFFFEA